MTANYREFEAELDREMEEVFGGEILGTTKKIAFDALGGVIRKTPVDTGRARAGWGVALGSAPDGPAELASVAEGQATIERAQPFQPIAVYNNVEYIRPLEDGHSQQAPTGIVGPTLATLASKYREVR